MGIRTWARGSPAAEPASGAMSHGGVGGVLLPLARTCLVDLRGGVAHGLAGLAGLQLDGVAILAFPRIPNEG